MKRKHTFISSLFMMICLVGMILGFYGWYLYLLLCVYPSEYMSLSVRLMFFVHLVVMPTIIPFTNANRFLTVVILDENGVTQKLFGFIRIRKINWNEICEIRLGTFMGGWIFFSKCFISNMTYNNIIKRKDVIQIGYSLKLIDAIREYTDREIIGYDNDSKE